MRQTLGTTWLDDEALAYSKQFGPRKAYVVLARNPHNPMSLPYGARRTVLVGIPDKVGRFLAAGELPAVAEMAS